MTHGVPATGTHPRHSLRVSLFVEVSILIALAVVLMTAIAFILARSVVRNRAYEQLQSVLLAKESAVERTVAVQREQVALLGQDPTLSRLPAVSKLVGFESLAVLEHDQPVRPLSGLPLSSHTLALLGTISAARQTEVIALFSSGIQTYAIITPYREKPGQTLVAIFQLQPVLDLLSDVEYLGSSVDIALGIPHDGQVLIFHGTAGTPMWQEIVDTLPAHMPLALALSRHSGTMRTIVGGFPAFAAYTTALSLGWGFSITVNETEVYLPANSLALSLLFAGFALVGCLSLIMFSLSKRIAEPLTELVHKLDGLEARGWKYRRSIYTGNEIDAVDSAAFDLTRRLRDAHVYLESVVSDRTRELTQQHAQDEAIFQSIEYGLLVTDRQGKILLMNSAGEQLTGWSAKLAIGRSFDLILRIVDNNLHAVVREDHPVSVVLRKKKRLLPSIDPKYSLFHRDGKIMPLSLRVTPIMQGRRCMGSVAVFRDTTEDRRIDRMKSDFISLVSHQLRTPLSTIRWYIELLLTADSGKLNRTQKSFVQQVNESNDRMVRLVDALLNVSRIELKKFSPSVRVVNILSILSKIEKTFAKDILEKKLAIEYRHHGASRWTIEADAVLLQMILENLLNNAIKYSRSGGKISIDFAVHREDRTATISVRDEGIGIPLSQQKHVFEKLFRADNAKQSDTNGNGLGLYISHLAAETINGSLQFESQENKGTTVSLTLPLKPKHVKKKG